MTARSKRGPGRPPLPKKTAKVGMFSFRVSEREASAIRAAADAARQPVTQWVRAVVLDAASKSAES